MIGSGLFWFVMGIITVVVALAFKAFAEDRGWKMTWWKWLLAVVWYGIFSLSFLALGTLIGEFETSAGVRIFLLGMFISLVLGVGLWRALPTTPQASA